MPDTPRPVNVDDLKDAMLYAGVTALLRGHEILMAFPAWACSCGREGDSREERPTAHIAQALGDLIRANVTEEEPDAF